MVLTESSFNESSLKAQLLTLAKQRREDTAAVNEAVDVAAQIVDQPIQNVQQQRQLEHLDEKGIFEEFAHLWVEVDIRERLRQEREKAITQRLFKAEQSKLRQYRQRVDSSARLSRPSIQRELHSARFEASRPHTARTSSSSQLPRPPSGSQTSRSHISKKARQLSSSIRGHIEHEDTRAWKRKLQDWKDGLGTIGSLSGGWNEGQHKAHLNRQLEQLRSILVTHSIRSASLAKRFKPTDPLFFAELLSGSNVQSGLVIESDQVNDLDGEYSDEEGDEHEQSEHDNFYKHDEAEEANEPSLQSSQISSDSNPVEPKSSRLLPPNIPSESVNPQSSHVPITATSSIHTRAPLPPQVVPNRQSSAQGRSLPVQARRVDHPAGKALLRGISFWSNAATDTIAPSKSLEDLLEKRAAPPLLKNGNSDDSSAPVSGIGADVSPKVSPRISMQSSGSGVAKDSGGGRQLSRKGSILIRTAVADDTDITQSLVDETAIKQPEAPKAKSAADVLFDDMEQWLFDSGIDAVNKRDALFSLMRMQRWVRKFVRRRRDKRARELIKQNDKQEAIQLRRSTQLAVEQEQNTVETLKDRIRIFGCESSAIALKEWTSAVEIQRVWRGFHARKKTRILSFAIIAIQKIFRGIRDKRRTKWRKLLTDLRAAKDSSVKWNIQRQTIARGLTTEKKLLLQYSENEGNVNQIRERLSDFKNSFRQNVKRWRAELNRTNIDMKLPVDWVPQSGNVSGKRHFVNIQTGEISLIHPSNAENAIKVTAKIELEKQKLSRKEQLLHKQAEASKLEIQHLKAEVDMLLLSLSELVKQAESDALQARKEEKAVWMNIE